MALYRFRCPTHGDFTLEQPMADTTRTAPCPAFTPHYDTPTCATESPKVLGSRLQFTYGRAAFHSGVEGTGETVRETGDRWRSEYKAVHGREPEPVGTRWV